MANYTPLAERLRPKNLEEIIGQAHLVGKDKPISQMLLKSQPYSLIFWGPPGSGKTTIARVIAGKLNATFHHTSAVSASKKEIKTIIERARGEFKNPVSLFAGKPARSGRHILFLDEIHRFNKAQQDFLLPYVEDGTLTLIGATTENPSFEVNSALLSRCRVYVLNPLSETELKQVVSRACKALSLKIAPEAKGFLASFASGDARSALGVIQTAHETFPKQKITKNMLLNILQTKTLHYDKHAEEHYNTISAFIKSMRASNIDSTLYYLARMVEAGEDPKFIARRMVVFASEDIGLAQPTALVVANAVFRAVETIGYPEAQINLAHGAAYLASCPKNRSSYDAYFKALGDVQTHGNLPIPLNLRNAPTKLMKDLDYGKDYEMYTKKSLLPDKLKSRKYYKNK
jgi:putative ATPase